MPKGFNTSNSPYGRKVRVSEIETGQSNLIDWWFMSREERADKMPAINPLGKIPALIMDNGTLIVDSPVIAAWVDSQHSNRKLIPQDSIDRWAVLTLEALGDGLGDAAIAVALEESRQEKERSPSAIQRNLKKVINTLSYLDQRAGDFDDRPNLGQIAVACAMGYMDFRGVASGWQDRYHNLSDWYNNILSRESFRSTALSH